MNSIHGRKAKGEGLTCRVILRPSHTHCDKCTMAYVHALNTRAGMPHAWAHTHTHTLYTHTLYISMSSQTLAKMIIIINLKA